MCKNKHYPKTTPTNYVLKKRTQQKCPFSLTFLHSFKFSSWLENFLRINGSFTALTVSVKALVFSFVPGKRMPTFLYKNFKNIAERDKAFFVVENLHFEVTLENPACKKTMFLL